MTRRQLLHFAAWVAGLVIVFFVFLWIGFAVQARKFHRAGVQALSEGAEIMAQGYFEKSIRSRCPFNSWGKKSAEELRMMAQGYEDKGAIPRAIDTYESLMTSLAATRTGWSKKRNREIESLEKKVEGLRKTLAEP